MCILLYSSDKTERWLLSLSSQKEEKRVFFVERACFKCVKLQPIIMPADKGNANTLRIKGAWNIKQPIS